MTSGIDMQVPGNNFFGGTDFYINQGGTAVAGEADDATPAMTAAQELQLLETTIDYLETVHQALQDVRSNIRPSDQIQNLIGGDEAAGIGFILRQTYDLLKALDPDALAFRPETSRPARGLDIISKVRRYASLADGAIILIEGMLKTVENGGQPTGDELNKLADFIGNMETVIGFLEGVKVNPVISAMLTVYTSGLKAAAQSIQDVIIPYVQRRQAHIEAAAAFGAVIENDPLAGLEESAEQVATEIDNLRTRARELRNQVAQPPYTDVTNATKMAFRNLGIDYGKFSDLRDDLAAARLELRAALTPFRKLDALRNPNFISTAETEQEQADLEADLPTHTQNLQNALDSYYQARRAYLDVTEEILDILREYAQQAINSKGDEWWLYEYQPHLYQWYWDEGVDFERVRRYLLENGGDVAYDQTTELIAMRPLEAWPVVDLMANPELMATTVEQYELAYMSQGLPRPLLMGTVTSTGNSTGPDAFTVSIVNLGKTPVKIVGAGVVFEPIEQDEHNDLANRINAIAEGVATGSLGAYCLEKEERTPSEGEFFTLANAGKQQQFGPQRRILRSSQELRESDQLNPDSDPDQYFHSIRQWAIWTEEQGFDLESFGKAFLEHTKKNVEAAGSSWTKEMEELVKGLIPNRWTDIQRIMSDAARM